MFSSEEENFLSLLHQGKGDADEIAAYLKKANCKLNPDDEGLLY
jgi:hypothetical protein